MKFLASALVLAQVQVFAQSVVGSSGLVGLPVYSPSLTSYVGQSAPVVFEGKLYTPPLTSVYAPASTAVRTTFPYTPIASTNFVASTGFPVNAAPATAQKGQPTPWITQTFNPSLFPQATTNVSLPGAIPYTPAVPVSQTTALQQSGARPTFTTYSSPAVVSSSSYSPVTATFPPALSIAQSTIPYTTYVPSTVFPSSGITIPNSAVVPASFTGATTVFPPASSGVTIPNSAVVPTYVTGAATTTTVFPPASSGITIPNSAVVPASFTGATTFPATTSSIPVTSAVFPATTTTSTGFPASAFPASNTFNAQATASSSFPTFTGSANVGAAASAGAGTGDDYYYD